MSSILTRGDVVVRPAVVADAKPIMTLVNELAMRQVMLPRSPASVIENIRDFVIAEQDGVLAGCGALRPLPDVDYPNACEMKRLYVRRAFRGFGLGRLLAQALIDRATQAGYSTLLLDTLDDMEAARGLYGSLGFEEIPPYYFNPVPGAHYLKVALDDPGTRW